MNTTVKTPPRKPGHPVQGRPPEPRQARKAGAARLARPGSPVRARRPAARPPTPAMHLEWDEPRAALLGHRVDAAVTRLPFPTDQLHVTVLYDEPRVLLVPLDHRLAGKEYVTLDDIADEPLPRLPDPAWNAFWRIDPGPTGVRRPTARSSKRSKTSSSSSPPGKP